MKHIACGLNSILCGSDGVWNFCTPDELSCSVRYSTDLGKTVMTSVLNMYVTSNWFYVDLNGGSKLVHLLMILLFLSFDFHLYLLCLILLEIGTLVSLKQRTLLYSHKNSLRRCLFG